MVRAAIVVGALVLARAAGAQQARAVPPEPEPANPTAPAETESTGEKPASNAWENAPATRRSGFTAGLMGGLAFGTVTGYPNDFSKIDQPAFRAVTSGAGQSNTIYLGGALTDWFTFAFGIASSSYGSSQLVTQSGAFLFHVEAFPLFARGGAWRDLGLFADFGTGTAKILRRTDQAQYSASGPLSIVGLGAIWETWHPGHFVLGPFGAYHYETSNAMTRHFGEIGFRGAFYGGP
jgi:hypothetical protein